MGLTARCLLAALAVFVAAPSARGATADDPLRGRQWGLSAIRAADAWKVADGAGAVIAIVDSGVDLDHPDLAAKLVAPGADVVDPVGVDGPQDEHGHGTHVAGIAAAVTGNGVGIAGVAPGALLLPVRVLDRDASGTTETIAQGIRIAADAGAEVINLSLGYESVQGAGAGAAGALAPVNAAIDYAWSLGAVIVASAGNDSVPLCAQPAAHRRVLCVGALDRNGLRSWYSNSDAAMTTAFVVAPGGDSLSDVGLCDGDVLSTWLDAGSCDGAGYEALGGTSQAAAHVSGVAALLAGQGRSNAQIVTCITTTTADVGPSGRDAIYGYGKVDALAAVTKC